MRVSTSLVVIALVVGACTATVDLPPTSQPSSSSLPPPTTTSTLPATTTTDLPSHDVGLYRVDPATLTPVTGTEPLTTGDWITGRLSDNGEWLALHVWIESDPETNLIQVIHIPTGEIVTEMPGRLANLVGVADDGTVYTMLWRVTERWTLRKLVPGATGFEVVSDALPSEFVLWGQSSSVQSDHLVFLGSFGGDFEESVAGIVTIDLTDGSAESYRLPDLTIGIVGEVDLGDWSAPEFVEPALVWDPTGNRALVVHGDRLAVTEVDLATGDVAEHDLSSSASWWGRLFTWLVPPALAKGDPSFGIKRSAVLSPSGEMLYVASARSEVVWDDDGEWEILTLPQGVQAIDTVTWEMVARWDIPASTVALSPNGNYLVAGGTTITETLSTGDFGSEGIFVIDTGSDELIGHLDGPNEYPEVHFSPDGDFLYMVGSGGGQIDIVDLTTLEVTDTAVGPEQLALIGDVSLLVTSLR